MTTYTPIRKCFNCGSVWEGYGNICNACKTIDAISNRSGSAEGSSNNGRYEGGVGEPHWSGLLILFLMFLFVEVKLNFLICRSVWLLFKIGTYLIFGWWLGISPKDWI